MRKIIVGTMLLLAVATGLAVAAPPVPSQGTGNWCCWGVNNRELTVEQQQQVKQWQQQRLEQHQQILAQQVKWGWLTQDQADQRLTWLEKRSAQGMHGHSYDGVKWQEGRHGHGGHWQQK